MNAPSLIGVSMPDNAKLPPEPSMEEIIASISRIITEDQKPNQPVTPATTEASDILELTEVVNEDGSVRRVAPISESPTPPSAASSAAPKPESEPDATGADLGDHARLETTRARILSSATSGAAAAAFARLGALPRERHRESELRLGEGDKTLEDIVRELLQPLLQTWLDEHLPGIVERLVREEIARVVGEAGLR
jgi:cell pole-organizing protein PopZ